MNPERCRNCGSMLEFVGFDRRRRRVLQCLASLSMREDDKKTHTSVPCSFNFIVDGMSHQAPPQWLTREDEDDRSPRESWARCRDHGLELAVVHRPKVLKQDEPTSKRKRRVVDVAEAAA